MAKVTSIILMMRNCNVEKKDINDDDDDNGENLVDCSAK